MDPRFQISMDLPRATRDFQLSPSKSAKDAAGVLDSMVARTRAAQSNPGLHIQSDLPYGPRARQRLDVFRPAATSDALLPCLIFLHGGFWQEGGKSVSGFAAQSLAAQGWASVAVGYTLTPDVTLTALTQEAFDAVAHVKAHAQTLGIDPARIVLAGHSAGAHLAAAVLTDVLGRNVGRDLAGFILLSGVYELAPIAASYVNDVVGMSESEIARLSPARYQPKTSAPVHLVVGQGEPEAFRVQTHTLAALWDGTDTRIGLHDAEGRDHFDVLEELCDPASATWQAMLDMV